MPASRALPHAVMTYAVRRGETLWTIAQTQLGHGTALVLDRRRQPRSRRCQPHSRGPSPSPSGSLSRRERDFGPLRQLPPRIRPYPERSKPAHPRPSLGLSVFCSLPSDFWILHVYLGPRTPQAVDKKGVPNMRAPAPSGPRIATVERDGVGPRGGAFTANTLGSKGNRACSAAQFFQPENHGIG